MLRDYKVLKDCTTLSDWKKGILMHHGRPEKGYQVVEV